MARISVPIGLDGIQRRLLHTTNYERIRYEIRKRGYRSVVL